MAGAVRQFRSRKLKDGASAIPLVLQSGYQWNEAKDMIVKSDTVVDVAAPGTRHELKLVPEALDMLERIQKPVAVLAICGPYRSGKSFFISRVVGQPGTFKLGHSMEVCTRGVWLSTTALECDEFVLLLLDTEGTGAVEGEGPESFTTKLLVTTILISSFLIYNSMEVPKQADLQQMSSFAHLSTAINVSDTKADNPKEFQKYFPRFMWLLRDVTNPPCNEDEEDIPLIEYLNDEVLISTGQEDCDKVIAAIRDLFPPPLMCDWLPLPNDDPEEWNLEDERNVDEYFLQRLDEVINGEGGIKASLTPKVGCNQVMVTGSDLAVLARFYVEAINKKDSVPSLEGSWKAVIKLKLAKEVETLVASYVQEMKEELTDEQPIEECTEEADCTFGKPTLMDLHKVIFTKKHEILTKKVRQLLSDASESEQPAEESEDGQMIIQRFESDIVVKEGKKVKRGKLYEFVVQNRRKSENQCTNVWTKLEKDSEINDAFTEALNKYNPEKCYKVLMNIHSLRENYNKEAIGPAKEDVFTANNKKWQEREVVLRSIPGPPTNVAVVGKARDAIKLQWDEPKINPEAATTYIVENRKGTSAWVKDKETSEQWHIVRQLKSNTKYEFRVSSWNANTEKVKKTIEEMLQENTSGGLKMGTRLGRLARATLSTIGFLGGTAVAPLLSTIGMPALAMESKKKAAAAAACVSIPFFATLGAPIVGGRVAYHVMEATAACGDLEERYVHVPRQNSSEAQSAHSSTE